MTDAFDWYEDRVPGLGSEFLLCVDAVFSAILRTPQQYPLEHGIVRRALTRRFPYEVFFVPTGEFADAARQRLVILQAAPAPTSR